jgi:hypothetical protein
MSGKTNDAVRRFIEDAQLRYSAQQLAGQATEDLESAGLLFDPERAEEIASAAREQALAVQAAEVEELRADVSATRLRGLLAPSDASSPGPAGPESRCAEDELTGARLSLWEEEQENARLTARVAELEAETYVAPSPSCTRCYGADAARFVAKGGATSACRVCGPSEAEQLRSRVAELEDVERRLLDLLPTEPLPAVMLAEDIPAVRSEWAVWQQVAEALDVRVPYTRPVDEDPIPYQLTEAADTTGPEVTVYRAEYDVIPFGLYTTPEAARAHCEAHLRREQPTAALDWIVDDEDGVAELVTTVDGSSDATGYVVIALEVASAYDEEADE